jgi:hypothetical protein
MPKAAQPFIALSACLLLLTPVAGTGSDVIDPEQWYRDGYAPLWHEQPAENLEAMLGYYAEQVRSHRTDGEVSDNVTRSWLGKSLTEWGEAGWTRSELTALEVDRINDSTAAFKARWLDHYSNAPEERSCGWYLADRIDGQWRFTVYADLDCAAHGL